MKWFVILFSCLVAAGSAYAAPASAAGQVLVTHEATHIGSGGGTFSFAGDFTDVGSFTFDSFFSAGPPAPLLSTEHLVETYTGTAGTLTVQKECLSVFIGGGLVSDVCQAVVLGGTGAYAGLHGAGTCEGVINLVTGIAEQTCELRLTS